MPTYEFKCPGCLAKIKRELLRKRKTLKDECNAGPNGRRSVVMTYLRTVPTGDSNAG